MLSGMMWGTRWGSILGAIPVWNVLSPCGYTLRGGSGAASGVVSQVFTLRGDVTCGGIPC